MYSFVSDDVFLNVPKQAYTEAYDAVSNQLRVQGRFKESHIVELFYLSGGLVFQYDSRSPSTTCSVTPLSSYPMRMMVRPSVQMFDNLANATSTTYVGQSMEVCATVFADWPIT
jgi:hypothetical protein